MASPSGFLGILMLDTRFPRPPGDIGNPHTFERAGIPVRFSVVAGASPQRIVREADPAFLQPFINAARELQAQGATLLSTSCGFLAAYQQPLAEAVTVPVISSSLLQCRDLTQPGIVTFDADALTPALLRAAGVPVGTSVSGLTHGCELHQRILDNATTLDLAEAERNVVDAALRLVAQHPQVQNIVLECTNMPPYRHAVAQATGRSVHDLETLLRQTWAKVTGRTSG